jgi:hypothetical protein
MSLTLILLLSVSLYWLSILSTSGKLGYSYAMMDFIITNHVSYFSSFVFKFFWLDGG